MPTHPRSITLKLPAGPSAVERGFLLLGDGDVPGRRLTVTSHYLELDGQPWMPVMGEFHYTRCPADEWATELRKMRAGGIDVVASYVLWNHHEAAEGVFDWSGQRDLRRFVQLAHEAGLLFYLRPGPWAHAEARYGGLPDWLIAQPPLRCNDTRYLGHVERFFGQIGEQLRGLMWCDGGPIVGVQLENEYDGRGPGRGAEHIASLKQLAQAAGLNVPLYSVTGWPTLDIPPREVLPVSGAYADGFWFGALGPQPPSGVFLFNTSRAIGEMGNVGGTPAEGRIDPGHYPFFLAEAGGGMHVSYHRRPVVSEDDVAACALVQIGSGATLYGYYMYHGGTNPARGLHETQATGYPNDVPELAYDFRAPLGQYGQQRASYGRLRTLHSFIAAFGAELATMDAVLGLSDEHGEPITDPADRGRLRVAARGAGASGFVFVNNHLRHHALPAFPAVQLHLRHADGRTQAVPSRPVDVPAGAYFIWPFGQRLGAAVLHHGTVQALTRWVEGDSVTWVAFAHPALPVELCFAAGSLRSIDASAGWQHEAQDDTVTLRAPASLATPQLLRLVDAHGTAHRLVLLSQAQADAASRQHLAGRDRLVLCAHGLHAEGETLVLSVPHDAPAQVRMFPADDLGWSEPDFATWTGAVPATVPPAARCIVTRDAQRAPPLREGPHIAWRGRSVPLAPEDAHYDAGTHVRIEFDAAPPAAARTMLALAYSGDTARLYADGELVDDHFNDGEPWLIGVDRFVRDGGWPVFELRSVPFNADLPIFLEAPARQRLVAAPQAAFVLDAQVTVWRRECLHFAPRSAPTWLA